MAVRMADCQLPVANTAMGLREKRRVFNLQMNYYGLGVPDVSRERRCLQTSPEQLKATKDKKKVGISVPGRLGSFSVGGTKIKTLKNTQKFHTSGVCPRENKNARTKIGQ